MQDYQIPETLIGEFLDYKTAGDKVLLKGLDLMLSAFFAQQRWFTDENDTEAVTEAYHFARHFFTNKQLFNPKTAAK